MQVIVEAIYDLTDKIRSFTLRAENGGALAKFTAGAHIAVSLHLPGGRAATRKYSILSDPAQSSQYEIAVLRELDGSGGSQYMHTRVTVGQILEISEPVNHFPLSIIATHNVLLAGGIGVTPLLSMLYSLCHRGASFEVHYAARTKEDHIYKERIQTLAGRKAYFYHSEGIGKRRLDLKDICTRLELGTHLYACGPTRFYETLNALVKEEVIPADALHHEHFGVQREQNKTETMAELSKSGRNVLIQKNQAIIDALTQSGISVTYDCMRGECGMCAVSYWGGEVEHRDYCLSDEARNHRVCLCVSKFKSDKIVLGI